MAVFALLPIAAFLLLSLVENYPNNMTVTWANYAYILEGAGMTNLINSLVMSLFTATVGVAIGFFAAYFTARMKSPLSKVLNLLAISSMAIPGMVLGLSYLMTFSGGILAGTMVILVMVNTAHFLSSPYLMMYNSFGKMNENLEAVGSTLGIGRLRMLGRVFLPRNFGTLAEMFSYLFVNSMMTISAVAFLASDETKPISLLIKDLERSPKQGRVAVVSILILLVNVAIKIIVEGVKAIKLRKNA
jgi:iron(III) transport system permease protein